MREHLTTRAPDGRSVTLRLLKPEDAPRGADRERLGHISLIGRNGELTDTAAFNDEFTYDLLATDPR